MNEGLMGEINEAYEKLSDAAEALARADREISEYVRGVRLENAEALLEAKNERTANLYLEGMLDTDEYRALRDAKDRAELDYGHARREVERLHLIVRLLSANPEGASRERGPEAPG